MKTAIQPWLSPQESVEAIELLVEAAEVLLNTARFGSMRKNLRADLERQAGLCQEFARRKNNLVVDESVMLAAEEIALRQNVSLSQVITDALEQYISTLNRGKKHV